MRKLVLLGVILHFVIGVGHLACLFCLEAVFNIYGINGMMGEIAAHGAGLPYLITVCISIAFFYRRKLRAVGSWTRPSDATPEDRGHHYVGCLLRENDLGNNDAGRELFMA